MSRVSRPALDFLEAIDRRLLWLASWTIHDANHEWPAGEVKVGGHQASSAARATIMTALSL